MFIFKRNRRFHSVWGDYRMYPLQDIRRVHYEALQHHFLNSHLDALRSIRNTRKRVGDELVRMHSSEQAIETDDNECDVISSSTTIEGHATYIDIDNVLCSVCGLDPTWSYITHSESTRADVTHVCSACRKYCCSVCSPAGEQIPADGVNKFETLQDVRIPIPSLGMLEPHRVCLPCYHNCYKL